MSRTKSSETCFCFVVLTSMEWLTRVLFFVLFFLWLLHILHFILCIFAAFVLLQISQVFKRPLLVNTEKINCLYSCKICFCLHSKHLIWKSLLLCMQQKCSELKLFSFLTHFKNRTSLKKNKQKNTLIPLTASLSYYWADFIYMTMWTSQTITMFIKNRLVFFRQASVTAR